MNRYRMILPYVARQWKWLCVIVLLTIASSVTLALQPLPLKLLVDSGLNRDPLPAPLAAVTSGWTTSSFILACAGAIVALAVLNNLISSALTWAWSVAGQRMVAGLGLALFGRLQRASFLYHQRQTIGDSLSRLTGDAWCVYTLAGQLIGPLQQILTLATVGAVTWSLNPYLAIVSLSAAPVLGWLSVRFGRQIK